MEQVPVPPSSDEEIDEESSDARFARQLQAYIEREGNKIRNKIDGLLCHLEDLQTREQNRTVAFQIKAIELQIAELTKKLETMEAPDTSEESSEESIHSGKPIAAVNLGKTRADDLLSLKIEQSAEHVLPALAAMLAGSLTETLADDAQ